MKPAALLRLGALLLLLSALVGTAVAFFLWSLQQVTDFRLAHPWLLYGLPLAGLGVGLLFHRYGRSAEGGNNLIIEQIHVPGGGVPCRMAPLILLGTLATHLCGGSAGREGTAVQMGGSLAAAIARLAGLGGAELRLLLLGGVAAGFGAVFGTPWAGAVFAVEVLTVGHVHLRSLPAAMLAAFAGDWVCRAWGIGHTHYHLGEALSGAASHVVLQFDLGRLGQVLLVAGLCGVAARLFATAMHRLTAGFRRLIPYPPLRPVAGGLWVIALYHLTGTADFLGLGVSSPDPHAVTLLSFFDSVEIHSWAWLGKSVFTLVTLASGFKGGEVTPLFYIGAALGNALAGMLHAPPGLFAALGFVSLFAGATKTPIACTLMGIELFGPTHAGSLAMACGVAYFTSGPVGIYHAQRQRLEG